MNLPNESSQPRSRGPSDQELARALPRGHRKNDVLVGVFVLLGVASVLVALFLLTDPGDFRGRYRITTLVEDAGGIRRGDPVQMRGVNIGTVEGFALVNGGVVLTLEVETRWGIPDDSRTRLVSSGLLGGRTVEVMVGDSPDPVTPGGQLLGENVEGLLDFPPELGQEAQEALDRIQALLSAPTVEAVQAGAVGLRELLEDLSRLAEAQGAEIARLTASLNRSAMGLEEATRSGEDLARAVARADTALLTVNRTSEVLLTASTSLQRVLDRLERGEGTLGQLSANPALYLALTQAAESIRLLAGDVREHPGRK